MIGYKKNKKKKGPVSYLVDIGIMVAIPVLFLILWEVAVKNGTLKATLTPPPSTLWKSFLNLLEAGKLQKGLLDSLRRVFTGYAIGTILGVSLGFLMGVFRPLNKALTLFVNVLRPIPTIAIIPIFIIIFGIGESTIIAVIIVGAFWPSLLNSFAGVQNTDSKLIELAYTYRIPGSKTLFKIIFPSAMTSILTGMRLGLGTAWMSVVAAEMLGSSSGIGYMIMVSRDMAQAQNMYVEVFIIGLIGLLFDRVLLLVQNKMNKKIKGVSA